MMDFFMQTNFLLKLIFFAFFATWNGFLCSDCLQILIQNYQFRKSQKLKMFLVLIKKQK